MAWAESPNSVTRSLVHSSVLRGKLASLRARARGRHHGVEFRPDVGKGGEHLVDIMRLRVLLIWQNNSTSFCEVPIRCQMLAVAATGIRRILR
jgi:hypothetical protein